MKRKRVLTPLLFIMGLTMTSCGVFNFEKNLDVVVLNVSNPTDPESSWTYEEVFRSKVNIFNSTILPVNNVNVTGKVFIGYGAKVFQKGVSKKRDFYKSKGLVRYNDVKKLAVNGTVTLKAAFVKEEDVPQQYIVVGWYGKTSISGLDSDKMAIFDGMLRRYIGPAVTDPYDIELREYTGDVATIGADITYDGDVDIFLGAGTNLGTTGGVTYAARTPYMIDGAVDRYTYKINTRASTNDVYDWIRTDEVRSFFSKDY